MVTAYKEIYNIFGSGIYHNPHSIFKSKSHGLQNMNIDLFSGNNKRTASYSMVMNRDLHTKN